MQRTCLTLLSLCFMCESKPLLNILQIKIISPSTNAMLPSYADHLDVNQISLEMKPSKPSSAPPPPPLPPSLPPSLPATSPPSSRSSEWLRVLPRQYYR